MTNTQKQLWEGIIEDVDKAEIPVTCLRRVTIKLNNGRRKMINVAKLRDQGLSEEEIEESIGVVFYQFHDEIKNVDFFVDTAEVANIVAPQTQRILGNYFPE